MMRHGRNLLPSGRNGRNLLPSGRRGSQLYTSGTKPGYARYYEEH
jgi:hypothetical protein